MTEMSSEGLDQSAWEVAPVLATYVEKREGGLPWRDMTDDEQDEWHAEALNILQRWDFDR